MGNYVRLGPFSLRVSTKHYASWGFDLIRIGGLGVWSRCSDGSRMIAGYHPRDSLTWLWALYWRSGRLVWRSQKKMPRKAEPTP